MKRAKTFYKKFISSPLQSSVPFILFALGIIAYVVSFFIPDETITKIVFDFAELMIVSFFVTLVTNTYMFINIFRTTMEEIVTDYKFMDNRKDIYDIWKKVSNILFSSKFREISDDLLKIINESYFPIGDSKYYSDYTYSVSIEWIDKEKNHIKVSQELKYDLLCDTKEEVKLMSKSWIKIDPHSDNSKPIEYTQYKVNKKSANIVSEDEYVEESSGDLVHSETILLTGLNSYGISKEINKQMDVDLDPYLGFKSQFILNKLRVQVFKPEDLCITFVPRGTLNEFIPVKNNKKYMEYQYNGLILPRQGFILILQRK